MLAGQRLGFKEVDDGIWLVSFLDYGLGFFDQEEDRVEPIHPGDSINHLSGMKCKPCAKNGPS